MSAVVVIGDVVVDRDVIGTATRMCPDGPAPVVDQVDEVVRTGGAGLTASLVRRQSPDTAVHLVAAFADDAPGALARRWLTDRGVALTDLVDHGSTTEKIRIRVDGRTLLRVDRGRAGDVGDPPGGIDPLRGAGVVLVSDYGRGVTAHPGVRSMLAGALARGVPVVWDPHPLGAPPLPGSTVVVPNTTEAGMHGNRPTDLGDATRRTVALRQEWGVGAVALTMGSGGALLVSGDGVPLVVPVDGPGVHGDTCGAGDAFAAGVALALAQDALLSQAVAQGVTAAVRYLRDGGPNAAATGDDALDAGEVGDADGPRERPASRLVAAGGCFDILHAGHIAMLRHAHRLGDRLVVLLNSDASVRRLKGPGRPVQRDVDRAAVIGSLSFVDDVIVFDEDTPAQALERLRPDVFVKGGDYTHRHVHEQETLERWGGTVVSVPFVDGLSTTSLLASARGSETEGARTHAR